MSYENTRTAQFEQHLQEISDLRGKAVKFATAARAFDSIESTLNAVPSEGEVFDGCLGATIEFVRARAAACRKSSVASADQADTMEARGLA